MGQCAQATFSYGFVLNDEEIECLFDALGYDDRTDMDELNSWLNSELFEPFCFSAQRTYMEDDEEEQQEELVISFVGRDDGKLDSEEHEHKLEIWGRENAGVKCKSIPMPIDKEFSFSAKEAFQKLKDSEVFKQAEITEIEPQWVLTLSVG